MERKKGFTIVELLIVVVVVAILATITVTAFNAVQDRANNARTEKAVTEFRKALLAYATVYRQYPAGGTTSAFRRSLNLPERLRPRQLATTQVIARFMHLN